MASHILQSINVLLLAVAHQVSLQSLIQEVIIDYLKSKSADKGSIFVENSLTSIGACTNCAKPTSAYANPRKHFFDYSGT
jgi:hypothetical protein